MTESLRGLPGAQEMLLEKQVRGMRSRCPSKALPTLPCRQKSRLSSKSAAKWRRMSSWKDGRTDLIDQFPPAKSFEDNNLEQCPLKLWKPFMYCLSVNILLTPLVHFKPEFEWVESKHFLNLHRIFFLRRLVLTLKRPLGTCERTSRHFLI